MIKNNISVPLTPTVLTVRVRGTAELISIMMLVVIGVQKNEYLLTLLSLVEPRRPLCSRSNVYTEQ